MFSFGYTLRGVCKHDEYDTVVQNGPQSSKL